MYYVYMLRCNDNSLYTGSTNDIYERLQKHNSGKGAKYTLSRRPVTLVYFEEHKNKNEALKREWQIKKLNKNEKEMMIKKTSN